MLGEKKNYKYLGILESKSIKQVEMKKKSKSVLKEQENFLKLNSSSKNLIKGINTRTVFLLKYSEPFLK